MSEINNECPEIPEMLLKYLKTIFPDVLPQCEMGEYIRESAFMRLIGHQDVISYLEAEFKEQQQEVENGGIDV